MLLTELLGQVDVLNLYVKLTVETRGLTSVDELEQLPADALLVGTSRGLVVGREALPNALRNEAIQGTVLGVFHEELPDAAEPLLE